MTITKEDVEQRFIFHPPDEEKAAKHARIRREIKATAETIVESVPEGREQSLAITKMEEAMFWANAGLARSGSLL